MISDEEMDLWLWGRGLNQWVTKPYSTNSTVPHELDYLRGIHNSPALTVLASWLANQVGCNIRLRTMWQDKHVYVKPALGAQRELADIAIIVQKEDEGRLVSRTMWLLQAKVASAPHSVFSGKSSKKEIELFEGIPPGLTPQFQVLSQIGGPALLPIFPAGAFNGPNHWSFLTLHRDPKIPVWDAMRERWRGSTIVAPVHSSFCGGLIKAINGTRGMPVNLPAQPGDHWSALYQLLMTYSLVKPSTGHAMSAANPTGAIMQFSTMQQAAIYMSQRSRQNPRRFTFGWRASLNRGSSTRSSGAADSGKWMPFDETLLNEAFGDIEPPDGPNSDNSFERMDPSSGIPLIIFIDVAGKRG